MENWKILIYQNITYDKYEINQFGIIRNINTGFILKQTLLSSRNGTSKYFTSSIGLGKRGKSKTVILHRALAETFLENPNKYKYVLFKDGNYENLNIENLIWHDSQKLHSKKEEQYIKRKKSNAIQVSNRRRQLKMMAVEYKGGKCIICGYDKYIRALEFHHLNADSKDFSISTTGTTRSWEKNKIELDKCICVCANCHREIHGNLINLEEYLSIGELA